MRRRRTGHVMGGVRPETSPFGGAARWSAARARSSPVGGRPGDRRSRTRRDEAVATKFTPGRARLPSETTKAPLQGLRVMRRRGLEPPPGYPGPGPHPGNPGVISVRIAPDRPHRPGMRTIRTDRTIWMLPRMLPHPRSSLRACCGVTSGGGRLSIDAGRFLNGLVLSVPSGARHGPAAELRRALGRGDRAAYRSAHAGDWRKV